MRKRPGLHCRPQVRRSVDLEKSSPAPGKVFEAAPAASTREGLFGMTPKKAAVTLFVPALVLIFCGCAQKSEKRQAIAAAFAAEMARYPQATLIDIYKFFFQGAFGPGHMIPNAAAARQYLERELSNAADNDSVLWHPVGYTEEYYRIHLAAVHEGRVSADDLLQAFVASANAASPPSLEEWRLEWRLISDVLESQRGQLTTFHADRARLEEMLERGESVVHHSEIFEEKYQPHYRVIHRRYVEQLRNALQGNAGSARQALGQTNAE